ncbi:MAG TPA: sigma-70 family RNA polymerase sigma factor [Puia sp.]|nr:sigma-70 family RNA polymerase sigma factor [Puia sp.]
MPFENIHNEKELLLQVANGDRIAFQLLYKHYYPLVEYYVSFFAPSDSRVRDLTQDVFVRIWDNHEKLAAVEAFKPYVKTMTRNLILNYIRALKMRKTLVALEPSADLPSGYDTENEVLSGQYLDIISTAIDQLPDGRRKILKMSIDDGLSLDEIAEKLQISRSGVKKQLYAATRYVREYLREHGELSLLLFVFLSLFEV